MTQSILVKITHDDIEFWKRDQTHEPLLNALHRITQTPWRMTEINKVSENAAPFRTLILRSDVVIRCREHILAGEISPFEFEAELQSPFSD